MPATMRCLVVPGPAARLLTAVSVAVGLVTGAAVPAWAGPARPGSPAGPPPIPAGVTATSFVLADAATGRVLAERAPHQRLRPASTLKVLTALALMPRLDPAAVHVSTPGDLAALYADEPGASAVGVRPGLSYRVSDLWNGVFLRSGNDAIATLAHIAGGVPVTLDLMRRTARRLHADDTVVVNADGYDADGQVSTAYDLALMARAGLQDPVFRAYCGLSRARFPGTAHSTYEIDTENRLLGRYPGMIGVKNGYTSLAHHTFVGAAERGGRTLLVTVMDAGLDIYKQTASLLDWGFAQNPGPTVDQLAAADPLPRATAPGQAAPAPAASPGAATAGSSQPSQPAQSAQSAPPAASVAPGQRQGGTQAGGQSQGRSQGQDRTQGGGAGASGSSGSPGSAGAPGTARSTGSSGSSGTSVSGVSGAAGSAKRPHKGAHHPLSVQHPVFGLTAAGLALTGGGRNVLVGFGGVLALVFLAVVLLRLRVLRRRRLGGR